jgi:hypothetical protein
MEGIMSKKRQSKNRGQADKPKLDWKALVVHPHAAGIDIGGRSLNTWLSWTFISIKAFCIR